MIELIFELLFQFVVEIFGDVIMHTMAEDRRTRNAVLAFLGYAAAGVAVGYLTILIFPMHFIREENIRFLNLAVTPLAIAGVMTSIGRLRAKREKRVIRLEHFTYAYVFALAIALVRYWAAT